MGNIINFNNICPERYKTGVIKAMLHISYNISSDWKTFTNHFNDIRQLLANNNFPMKLIDCNIEKFINKKYENSETNTNTNDINLYKNQM